MVYVNPFTLFFLNLDQIYWSIGNSISLLVLALTLSERYPKEQPLFKARLKLAMCLFILYMLMKNCLATLTRVKPFGPLRWPVSKQGIRH